MASSSTLPHLLFTNARLGQSLNAKRLSEGLLVFSLQAEPTANINERQEMLKREKKRIETLVRNLSHYWLASFHIFLLSLDLRMYWL